MRIQCKGCGRWHDISPTGLAVIIDGFQQGDLTHVQHALAETVEVVPVCVLGAFDDPARLKEFRRRYKGNVISVDGESR